MSEESEQSDKIEKVRPTSSELLMSSWQEKVPVNCPVPGCSHIASNSSVLNLHKAKAHNITSSPEKNDVVKQFYCPVETCKFYMKKHLKSIDSLKVHYMNFHCEKNYKCEKCLKAFALLRDCERHQKDCGQTHTCPECGKGFAQKYSLLKHCDVQKHKRPEMPAIPGKKPRVHIPKVKKEPDKKTVKERKSPAFILPKPSPDQILVSIDYHNIGLPTFEAEKIEYATPGLQQFVSNGSQASTATLDIDVNTATTSAAPSQLDRPAPGLSEDQLQIRPVHIQTNPASYQTIGVRTPLIKAIPSQTIAIQTPFSYETPNQTIGIQTVSTNVPKQNQMTCTKLPIKTVSIQTSVMPYQATGVQTHISGISQLNVQGIPNVSFVKSAKQKTSMGMQTIMLIPPPAPAINPQTVETQTGNAILQSAMAAASLKVVKVSKGTQKSPLKSTHKRRISRYRTSSSSQTSSPISKKKHIFTTGINTLPGSGAPNAYLLSQDVGSQFIEAKSCSVLETAYDALGTSQDETNMPNTSSCEAANFEMKVNEFLASMSTQTDQSSFLNQILPHVHDQGTQIHKGHFFVSSNTQTLAPEIPKLTEKHTQTKQTVSQKQASPLCVYQAETNGISVIETKSDDKELQIGLDTEYAKPANSVFVSQSISENSSGDVLLGSCGSLHKYVDFNSSNKVHTVSISENLDSTVMKLHVENPVAPKIEVSNNEVMFNFNDSGKSLWENSTQTMGDIPWNNAIGTQTVGSSDMNIATQTMDNFDMNIGTQTINNLNIHMGNPDINIGTQTLCDFDINMGTQTMDNFDINMGTQTMDNFDINMGTQTMDNFDINMGTQTMDNFDINMGTQTMDNFDINMGTQTMDNFDINMGTQTMDNFDINIGTQTMDNFDVNMGTQSMDNFDINMGTQTMTDFDLGLQSSSSLEFGIGTQTSFDPNWNEALESIDELAMEMGTQTLEDFITDSHTQTQTLDLEECFASSQTQTQTFDDFMSNSQTQTFLEDYLMHSETQTLDDFITDSSATQTQSMNDISNNIMHTHT